MAFLDENGKITIDEDAANTDISKIQSAQEILQVSRTALRSLVDNAGTCVGDTPEAIVSVGNEILSQLNQLDQKLSDTVEYIRYVVQVYYRKDMELKALMETDKV